MTAFGVTSDGRTVGAVTLSSEALTVRILTYGAVINDVRLAGLERPLTLGSPDIDAYEGPLESFGSLMGPVVNRIAGATARIDGRDYRFEANFQGEHTLHAGRGGSHAQVWEIADLRPDQVTLTLALPDGLGGFPGDRSIRVIYRVEGTRLSMDVAAESSAPTLFSFANHSYWALDDGAGFAAHILTIPAGRILEANDALMPTGRVVHVEGTEYDARRGLELSGDDRQFFDLNYCFNDGPRALHEVARLRGTSGVEMRMETTAPGLQVYDCGTIDGAGFETHHGAPYGPYSGLALEAQHWPGAAHHPGFPRIEYAARERYHQLTRWSFGRV